MLRLREIAARKQVEAALNLIHEVLDKNLEPVIATQQTIERVLKQLLADDFVAFGLVQLFAQSRCMVLRDLPKPLHRGSQQLARFGQIIVPTFSRGPFRKFVVIGILEIDGA